MAASKSKAQSIANHQDVPLIIEKSLKSRKHRKGKAKEDPPLYETASKLGFSQKLAAESTWSWAFLTDSAASTHPAIFTKDGSYFFSIVTSSVKVYASSTGKMVSTLSASSSGSSTSRPDRAHKDRITAAVLNPHNPFQLITASLDGCIKVWDFLEAALLQTIDIEQPILQMTVHEKFKNCVFAAVSRVTKKKNSNGNPIEDNAVVWKISLTPTDATAQSSVQKSSGIRVIGKTRPTTGLAFSSNGSWLVAIAGHKTYVSKTSDLRAGFTKFVSSDRLTCLAFHPTEEYFATGDAKGNIRLWYCLNDGLSSVASGVEKRAQTTSFHWHAHAVSSIAFTPNGAYLLSGGEECVLVIWQLHTGKKEFVPRMGAPISSISICSAGEKEEEYLLGLSDATYAFVSSASLRISRVFSRIKLGPALSWSRLSTSIPVPLATHPSTYSLILPSSHPSSLQTYAPSTSTLLSEIEVSPSNRVSRRDEKPSEPSRVQRVVVSPSGEWMATVDERQADELFRAEVYMKIWWWDQKSGFWILNSRVDRPHGRRKVTSISFNPGKTKETLQLVTTGEDDQVKLWRIRTIKDKYGKCEDFWVPRSMFGFRSESPSHASWSTDSSLLAVSCGPYIPLYDPATNALRQVLTCSECKHVISSHFLGKSGRYLAVAGKKDLVLWDLVSLSVRWHHRSAVGIDHIIPHPSHDTLALLQSSIPNSQAPAETRILLFRPSSAIPYETHTVPFRLSNAMWYSTSQSSRSDFSIVGITHSWNVALFGNDVQFPSDDGATATQIGTNDHYRFQKKSVFQEMFGISTFADVRPHSSSNLSSMPCIVTQGMRTASAAFDAPAYLMPPMESLFESLLGGFLSPRSETQGPSDVLGRTEDSDGEEVEMDVDEDVRNDDKPFIVDSCPARVVDSREMNDFIELFKLYGLAHSSSHRKHTSRTPSNGVTKQNGLPNHGPLMNGTSSTPTLKINGKTPTPVPQTPSPPATIGLKRKKSLGEEP